MVDASMTAKGGKRWNGRGPEPLYDPRLVVNMDDLIRYAVWVKGDGTYAEFGRRFSEYEASIGAPTKGGRQRTNNWRTRGIPRAVGLNLYRFLDGKIPLELIMSKPTHYGHTAPGRKSDRPGARRTKGDDS